MTTFINQKFAIPSASSNILTVVLEMLLYSQVPGTNEPFGPELVIDRKGWTQKMTWSKTHRSATLVVAKNDWQPHHRAELVIVPGSRLLKLVGGANISIDLRDFPRAGDWEFPLVGAASLYAATQPRTAEFGMCSIVCEWLSSIIGNWSHIRRQAMRSEIHFGDSYRAVSLLLAQTKTDPNAAGSAFIDSLLDAAPVPDTAPEPEPVAETETELYKSEAEHIVVLLDEACSRSGLEVACPVQGFADLPAHVSAVLDALWMRIP